MKAQILRRFSAQEHDTDTTIPVSALLWNLSFTQYISMYLYMIYLSAVCSVFQSYVLSVIFNKSRYCNCILYNQKIFIVLQDIQTRSNKTCTLQLLSINVSVLPSNAPLSLTLILVSFVSIYMNEPGL